MGNQVARRYKYGLRPVKYFNTKILPEMKETFGILDFTYFHAFELFKVSAGPSAARVCPRLRSFVWSPHALANNCICCLVGSNVLSAKHIRMAALACSLTRR